MKKDTHIILIICAVFLCAAGVLFYHGQNQKAVPEEFFSETEDALKAAPSEESDPVKEEEEGVVSVLGAVKHPGIFRYRGEARVFDAIEALGGFTKSAAKGSVNLAKKLTDGEQIQVLTKKQMKQQTKQKQQSTSGKKGNLVDINQAGREELIRLPGIGEAKADEIIRYREEHGSFAKTEDLMQIPGIKEGIFQKIKDLIMTG